MSPTDDATPCAEHRSPSRGLFRFGLRRLMALVALCAVLLSAWMFRRDNGSVERSLTSLQLRALATGGTEERRKAADDLAGADADADVDLARVVAALVGSLEDTDAPVRRVSARSLGSVLRAGAQSRKGGVPAETRLALGALLHAFDDPDARVRLEAVRAVGVLGEARGVRGRPGSPAGLLAPHAERTSEAITRALRDPDPQVRAAAVGILARLAPFSDAGPDPVLNAFEHDPAPVVRAAAAGALVKGWPDPDRLYPLLLRRFDQADNLAERAAIGWALGSLPAPPPSSLPALIRALDQGDPVLGQSIPAALARLGPRARPALPALARVAEAESSSPFGNALRAAEAIATIDADAPEAQAQLEPLVARLTSSEPSQNFQRQQAAVVLSRYGPSAAPAVPALREALASPLFDVRQRAAYILGRIGPAARAAIPELSALAADSPDPNVRQAAADALKRIAP